MTPQKFLYRNGIIAAGLLALIVMALVAGGCVASREAPAAPSAVTAVQTDTTRILISYPGSTETGNLVELEATITDSAGKTQTRSVGDRHSTTPLKFGATLPLEGAFEGSDHLLVTGYFMDGSQRLILDTTL